MRYGMKILETIENIVEKDIRYKLDAYNFVLAALDCAVKKLDRPRHISGKELLGVIKRYAQNQFGPMVRTVLEHWGITSTEDFGHIVFNLVEAKILSKTEEDSIEDFKGGYDFKQVFD